MTERELIYIRTIAETRSFSKASQKLFVSQPSLSQCVSNVEKELGTELFIRNKKGLILTAAGEAYVIAAERILKLYDDLSNEISEYNDLKKGKLVIGLPVILSMIILPNILPEFHRKYPNVDIELVEKNSSELEQMLLNSELDFAIIHRSPVLEPASESFDYKLISRNPFVIALPPEDPASQFSSGTDEVTGCPILDIKYLKDYPFLLVRRNNRVGEFVNYIFREAQISPNIILSTRNYENVRRLVSQGMGATVIPWEYRNLYGRSYKTDYYAFPPEYISVWDTSVVTLKNSSISRSSRVFIKMLEDYYHDKTNKRRE